MPLVTISSPEKNPHDPLMCGGWTRPRPRYGGHTQQTVRTVQFATQVGNVPVVSTHADRLSWDRAGWMAMPPAMKDRLVRNWFWLVPNSRFTGSFGLERILFKVTGFLNTQLESPLRVPRSVHSCDISNATHDLVQSRAVIRITATSHVI